MVHIKDLATSSSTSSSSSSSHAYDVFLSFRGADTRNSFTDHLYNALLDAGFITFLDDEEIDTGEPLKPELEGAIKSSRASIIVLSTNYASSTWCLDEMVLILEQKRSFNQIVVPVFYHVEPSHVRWQQGSFGEAMAKHKRRMEAETNAVKRSEWVEKMETWKKALTEVADLKGKAANGRKETEFITEVVTDIHRRLGLLLSNKLPCLIGMDYEIRLISSWLTDGSCHTADILTIVGMGGIGKTSLAKYVFQLHCGKFNGSSFVESISTRCNQVYNGLLDLQKQLHGNISKKRPLQVNDVSTYTSKIVNVLARKRVFIVLDDIDSIDELDALLGNEKLHPGSKVIITTKDASLTERCALFNPQVQPNHIKVSLKGLSHNSSLTLLCIHVFKSDKPEEGYEHFSEELVEYCEGHPLALEILGKSLHKREVAYWQSCIKGLKEEPHSRIKKALETSFDSLTFNDKELFKHIACFFVGMDKDLVETILNACDINTSSGITNLTDRCLLEIGWGNQLTMHQLVQEMGRDIVRQESPDKPWERSRLWCPDESFKVLQKQKSMENLLGLALDMRMLNEKKSHGRLRLKTNSLSEMDSLMLLQLNYVQLSGCFENVPEELRWLCLHGFPLKSISFDLPIENLVALDLSYSNIEYFDMSSTLSSAKEQEHLLGSLKILDLSFCEQLHGLGGFSELPELERLIAKNCTSLIEVSESIEHCVELIHIDLSYCYSLNKLPVAIGKLKKVKTLLLDGCNQGELQSSVVIINSQPSSSAIVEAIPSDLKFFTISLPNSFLRTLSLVNNNLCNESFPLDLSFLSMLEELHLDSNPIVSMPKFVKTLPRLEILSMKDCNKLVSVELPPRTLRVMRSYSSTMIGQENSSLRKIKYDPEMSPLTSYFTIFGLDRLDLALPYEIDGLIKVQPMADTEKRVLHSLRWNNTEFTKDLHFTLHNVLGVASIQNQMSYEFGIFSTFYEGNEMPEWIEIRSEGPSLSFTIPSSSKNLRGLNLSYVDTSLDSFFKFPMIKVSNITTSHTWIYRNYNTGGVEISEKSCLIWLSHWMFGPNEMKVGDEITITIAHRTISYNQVTKECGISLVYDDDDGRMDKEEDALSYYKSWNHIIGGDLSHFQLTTGEYILCHFEFSRTNSWSTRGLYNPFIDYSARFKVGLNQLKFKAFSSKNPARVVDEVHSNT